MEKKIDKAITALGKERKYALHENKQAFDIAIDIMRKYQKIQGIISKWDVGIYDDEGLCDVEVLEMISSVIDGEVLEDGNDKTKG